MANPILPHFFKIPLFYLRISLNAELIIAQALEVVEISLGI